MDREKAIEFALSRQPDNIGVARLCQELLADIAGKPVIVETLPLVPMKAFRACPGNIGNRNNPWGRAGKPK
jgi:hypothetical protein